MKLTRRALLGLLNILPLIGLVQYTQEYSLHYWNSVTITRLLDELNPQELYVVFVGKNLYKRCRNKVMTALIVQSRMTHGNENIHLVCPLQDMKKCSEKFGV